MITLGRHNEKWIDDAISEYSKRLKGKSLDLQIQIAKNEKDFLNLLSKRHPSSTSSASAPSVSTGSNAKQYSYNNSASKSLKDFSNSSAFLLDERGVQFNSNEFSDFLHGHLYGNSLAPQKELTFFVGGADGFPSSVLIKDFPSLCLSRLCFTTHVRKQMHGRDSLTV